MQCHSEERKRRGICIQRFAIMGWTARRRGSGSFLVSGRVSVGELNARLKLDIPPSNDEATIAALPAQQVIQ